MKNKIWFTGAHGTGKTTQLEYFIREYPYFNVLDVERRDLHAKGIINLNKRATPWDEIIIAGNVMYGMVATPSPFISDRSWICKCAYSQALPFPNELIDAWHIINVMSFPGFTDEDLYVYFPIAIPLEDDGVRSTDPEYQKEIDLLVVYYLDFFEIPYHEMKSETVQDRHLELERIVFK